MNPQITKLLEKTESRRISQILTAVTMYEAAKPSYHWAKREYKKRYEHVYNVILPEKDGIYEIVASKVTDCVDDSVNNTTVTVRSNGSRLRTEYSTTQPTTIEIDGHEIAVVADTFSEMEAKTDPFSTNASQFAAAMQKRQLKFTCKSMAGREALLGWIEDVRAGYWKAFEASPSIFIPRFGEWSSNHSIRRRPLDSVFGKVGQIDRIQHDLDHFFANEAQYNHLGIPYHRGYLFYGPPGTGKSSIAQAIANHFRLNVYYLPLAAVVGDVNLIDLINEVPAKSVLLIEDIDVYAASVTRADSDSSGRGAPTLASLLNALDGVCTPHGLITIMTTNSLEALDDAIIRPGRVDLKEEFTNLDEQQIDAIVRYMGVANDEHDFREFVDQSPAELMERIKTIKL